MDEQVGRGILGAAEGGAVGVRFDGPSPHVHRVPGGPPELATVGVAGQPAVA